jgi:hypothetical protein
MMGQVFEPAPFFYALGMVIGRGDYAKTATVNGKNYARENICIGLTMVYDDFSKKKKNPYAVVGIGLIMKGRFFQRRRWG